MKKTVLFLGLLLILTISCKTSRVKNQSGNKSPNIIYILADDLGYGELGAYGQKKIETPNIDALADAGMLFTQHYSGAPVCAPARDILLTGKHAGHAEVRGNHEWKERGDVWNYKKAVYDPNLEGQYPISNDAFTLGHLLQNAGYKTALVGKWGLGGPLSDGIPTKKGFDFFYGYNCQRQAHQLYPKFLWKNEKKVWLDNDLIAPGTPLDEGADPYDLKSYAKYQQKQYAPELMQKEVIHFIEENKDKPFFMYYATPLPHLPLQVPQKYVDRYVKKFGDEKPYTGKAYFPNRYPHAAYAAMISYLDMQVGEIVAKLKELGIYDNTLIIFTSDNGPTYLGGVDAKFFNSARPFKNGYGRTKGFTYEGGIRIPMIAVWKNKIKPGSRTGLISAFYDVMPTMAQLTNQKLKTTTDGLSYLPTLLGKDNQKTHDFLYWEFPSYHGQQAVRMGDWKGIRKDIFKGNMKIELYNLKNDIQEENDVADQYPEIVEKIKEIMKREHVPAKIDRFKFKELGDFE